MNTIETQIQAEGAVEPTVETTAVEANVEASTEMVATEVVETMTAADSPVVEPAVEVVSQEVNLNETDNILDLEEIQYPQFTLAKNKARFLRMLTWYRSKREWLDVAPMSGVTKLFKHQSKELEGIRANKLDYEMELETGTLTPSQRSYKKDELKMCKVQEKMAVQLITKMQIKIKSGRR